MGNKGEWTAFWSEGEDISLGICRRYEDIIKVDVERAGMDVCELAAVGWTNGLVAGSCECGKEPFASIKGAGFVQQATENDRHSI